MGAAVKAGIGLAVVVGIVNILVAAIGLQESNPILMSMVFLVVVIGLNIAAVFWALKQTAATVGYGKQLLNAAVLGLVGGVLIFALSMMVTGVLFPSYIEGFQAAMIDFLEGANLPEAQLEAQIGKIEQMTSVGEAVKGLIGTFLTSLVVGAIMAIFLRKK